MTTIDLIVIVGGLGAIAWVNWYFFVAGRRPATVLSNEVTITVDGGYDPRTVRVAAGKPVRLVFDRKDNSSCSEEVVFPDFGIRKFLPTGEKTTIDLGAPAAGKYDFMCGMSML